MLPWYLRFKLLDTLEDAPIRTEWVHFSVEESVLLERLGVGEASKYNECVNRLLFGAIHPYSKLIRM